MITEAYIDRNNDQPLPWNFRKDERGNGGTILDAQGEPVMRSDEEPAALIVRAVNHADKLAEALRDILSVNLDNELKAVIGTSPVNQARVALAAYEAAQ